MSATVTGQARAVSVSHRQIPGKVLSAYAEGLAAALSVAVVVIKLAALATLASRDPAGDPAGGHTLV